MSSDPGRFEPVERLQGLHWRAEFPDLALRTIWWTLWVGNFTLWSFQDKRLHTLLPFYLFVLGLGGFADKRSINFESRTYRMRSSWWGFGRTQTGSLDEVARVELYAPPVPIHHPYSIRIVWKDSRKPWTLDTGRTRDAAMTKLAQYEALFDPVERSQEPEPIPDSVEVRVG